MRNLRFIRQARFLSRSIRDSNNYIDRLRILKRNTEEILRQIETSFREELDELDLEYRNLEIYTLRRNVIDTLESINYDILRETNRLELFNSLLSRIPFG